MTFAAVLNVFVAFHLSARTFAQYPFPSFPVPYPAVPQPMPAPNMIPMPHLPPQPIVSPGGINFPLQQKLPVVVMPYYDPKTSTKTKKISIKKQKKKRRKPKKKVFDDCSSSENDSSDSSSKDFDFRTKSEKKRRQVLTPMVSYVTKDGYVVYQKKIKKNKAMDWLEMAKNNKGSEEERGSGRDIHKNKHHHHHHRHSHSH